MTHPQPEAPAPIWRFNPRAFLAREWPYLMVLILAIAGVAYTSFARTPITRYWVILAPLIGVICVVTRWSDAETRERRLHLIWTQALHWVAVLVAMHLMYVADSMNNVMALMFGVFIVFVLIVGSLWIMTNLNHNMMPMIEEGEPGGQALGLIGLQHIRNRAPSCLVVQRTECRLANAVRYLRCSAAGKPRGH